MSASIKQATQTVNRSCLAALAFLVWDIMVTLDQEVDVVWSQPGVSLIKCLYVFIRYVPVMLQCSMLFIGTELSLAFNFSLHDCYIWQVYQGVTLMFIIMAVDYILLRRVEALYRGSLYVKSLAIGLFVAEVAGMGLGLAVGLPRIDFDNTCAVVKAPQEIIVFGLACFCFQAILFALTAGKFVAVLRNGWARIRLLELLIRDGTWAFFLLLAIGTGSGFLFLLSNHAYASLLFGWTISAYSFVGYRLILNLRCDSQSHTMQPSRLTPLRFVSNPNGHASRPTSQSVPQIQDLTTHHHDSPA